ncbi:MAG TPA: DUF1684 domain-containing protein [Thermoanaerobaculia bacterium]|nr:DUF1684 domain-containing protein [Thermoanaerobaculia bacterium]
MKIRRASPLLAAALLAAAAVSCRARRSPAEEAYVRSIETWRAGRISRLEKPDGWLSLAGLFWLQPGVNAVGSASGSAVRLPPFAPARAGEIVLAGKETRWEPAPGSSVRSGGKPAEAMPLASDENGDATVLSTGTVSFFVIRRGDRTGVRVRDSASAARRDFHGLEHYPVSSEWRFEARFIPYPQPKHVTVPTILGFPEDDVSPGELEFTWRGRPYRIVPIFEQGSDELFIIFGDRTNGKATYGGGRFVYAPMPTAGKTVLDFNKAYNPPCVFTPYATCALPLPANHLPFEVKAGEKMYAESWELRGK